MYRRNYQKELERLCDELRASGEKPALLLHACCAPCSSYILEYLSEFFDITVYFCNPNIDGADEFERRLSELLRFVREFPRARGVSVEAEPYDHGAFLSAVKGHENDPEKGERCRICYRMRLEKTYEFFRRDGRFRYFCSSLSLSPLKDAAALNEIGLGLGEGYLPTDFKKRGGYPRSIELSREYGLYRQDYCGCEFSKRRCFEAAADAGSRMPVRSQKSGKAVNQ